MNHIEINRENMNEGILWIYLNRPEARNAISETMIDELTLTLKQADQDEQVKVIILGGKGKAFCAGGDIKDMREQKGMFAGESNELRRRYEFGIQEIPRAIEALSTPLVAMIDGPAIGAGCDLTCMCDIRLASKKAKFGETFSNLSLVPGDGGTFFLQRVIGYAKALELFLTGEILSAEKALEIGLVNYVFFSDSLKKETYKLAQKIASNSSMALQMTKKALKHSYQNDLDSSLNLLSAYQGITQRTKEHFERLNKLK